MAEKRTQEVAGDESLQQLADNLADANADLIREKAVLKEGLQESNLAVDIGDALLQGALEEAELLRREVEILKQRNETLALTTQLQATQIDDAVHVIARVRAYADDIDKTKNDLYPKSYRVLKDTDVIAALREALTE